MAHFKSRVSVNGVIMVLIVQSFRINMIKPKDIDNMLCNEYVEMDASGIFPMF